MLTTILSIWILQGLLMFVDEFYFHRKRRLKRWESLGHPVDTFLFLACFAYTLIFPFHPDNFMIFTILSIISTLIITKDEWVHTQESSAGENWLHSLLFIVHPIALIALFFAWSYSFNIFIFLQTFIISLFLIYQIIYWNFYQRDPLETKS
jgi:hypothetical protein